MAPSAANPLDFSAGTVANFGFKSGTRIIGLLVSLSIPKFAQRSRRMLANFGIGTLVPAPRPRGCVLPPDPLSLGAPLSRLESNRSDTIHASLPLLPADPARDAEGSGDRLASADVARRHDPSGGGRHLRLAAARLSRAQEGRADRARGAEPRRRDRAPDADAAARRPVARERALRRLRARDA